METTVWDRVDRAKIRREAKRALRRRLWVEDGEIRLAEPPLRPLEALIEALPANLSEEEQEEIEEGYPEPWEAAKSVIALLERCDPQKVQEEELVSCWVESSMCSSSWGLNLFTTPRAGYLVYIGEDPYAAEECARIYAMWQPVSSEAARRACATAVYAEHWRELTLPPSLGEFASGMQPLWMECLLELLRQEPACWEGISIQMPQKDEITPGRWEFVRRLTGLSESQMLELYREAGIELELEKSGGETRVIQKPPARAGDHNSEDSDEAGDDREEEEEDEFEEEEGRLYEPLVKAAAIDPVRARFVLANYCHALEHVWPPDRDAESF